jgi:hypothetical protein
MTRQDYIRTLREFMAEVREGAYAGEEGPLRMVLRLDVFEAEALAEMLEDNPK